jgi:oxygen-dependent protoporphyrinogen oxidase
LAPSVTESYGFAGSLQPLAPGEAARFLGFQVPQDDLGKGIRTFARGMGSVVDACARELAERASVRLGQCVQAVSCTRTGVSLALAEGSLSVDAVVVATGAAAAATVLQPLAGDAAARLANAPTLSSVTVELAYERSAIDHPLDGTGFVVAEAEQQDGLRACTFSSSKFAARAPAGKLSLRLFFRPEPGDLERLDDDAWRQRAQRALARVLGVDKPPLHAWVTRWGRALPVFSDAHRSCVSQLEQALAPFPVTLAGAAFHGSGIDAAVRSGERAAERWLACTS